MSNKLTQAGAWRDVLAAAITTGIQIAMRELSDEGVNFPWMCSYIQQRMADAAVNVLEAVWMHEQWLIDKGGLGADWTE